MIELEKYQDYSVQALLEDPAFLAWIKNEVALSKEQEEYLLKYPAFANRIEEARNIMAAIHSFGSTPTASPDFEQKLQKTMQEAKTRHPVRVGLRSTWAIAAAILLLVTLGIAFWPSMEKSDGMLVFETDYGEWKQVELPDGSTVDLNAGSKLVWQGGKERRVHLDGEAFFSVRKKEKTGANFTVTTEDLEVEVLGTRFNVQTTVSTGTEVFLEEGAVTIHTEEEDVKMVPDQLFSYKKGMKEVASPKPSQAVHHSSWKDGVINLQEQVVAVCFDKIEKIYGITIICEDQALLESVKTIAVPIDDLTTTKRILEQVFEVEMTQTNDSLIVN